jgi:hypothetical protein
MNQMLDHLVARKCDLNLYPGTTLTADEARFPLYNFGYKRTGFINYNPLGAKRVQNHERGKYYTYITSGEVGVFGLESIDFDETIILVSGLFKATALHRLGFCALHVSSISYRVLKPQLRLLGRPYFAIGDNDDEGAVFARRYGGIQSPVDVDEMADSDIVEMVNGYR